MRCVAALILVLCICGCVSGTTGGAMPFKTGPINSVLVIERLGTAVSRSTRTSFRDTIVQSLEACRIVVNVHDVDPLSLSAGGDDSAIAMSVIQRLRPDVVLLIRPEKSFVSSIGNGTSLELRMIEAGSNKDIWRGNKDIWRGTAFLTSGVSVYSSGMTMARELVDNMISSRVLRTCPPMVN